MKKILLITYSLFVGILLNATTLTERADSAYNASAFNEALQLYQKVAATEGVNSNLNYNLGNAYYRTGDIANAIVCYERALRLDPTNKDATSNLEFLRGKLSDTPGTYYSVMTEFTRTIAGLMSSNGWGWLALATFILFIVCAALYYFSDNVRVRKIGFFTGIVMILAFVFCISECIYSKGLSQRKDEAIIKSKSVILSTSPRTPVNRNEEAILLHEGTKLYIQDSIGVETDSVKMMWYDVMVDGDHRAWISQKDIEVI